jgi:hypothetical protein
MLDNNYSQQDINQALADLESMHSAGNINNSIYEDMKALLESKKVNKPLFHVTRY